MNASLLPCVVALLLTGCMSVPARYQAPARIYTPQVDRVGVSGFDRSGFRPTGGSAGAVSGSQVRGSYASWSGEYYRKNDAQELRWLLEETRCFRTVGDDSDGVLRVEGQASSDDLYGLHTAVAVLEALTLTPLIGMPVPDGVTGSATARLYSNGQYVKSYQARARLRYATTLYTVDSDAAKANNVAVGMALRDLADQIAADLCGAARSAHRYQ